MSGFGGGGGGRSGGRGRSRGRGRGGRGRGGRGRGGGYDNNKNNNPSYPTTILRPCSNFTKTGQCGNNNCKFSHAIRLHGMIDASTPKQSDTNNNNYNNRNNYNQNQMHAVTSVANWKTGELVKIFSGSTDGFWRLWALGNGSFMKEFEHNMGGSVECLQVASNFLFCGFESVSTALPEVNVGMIHAWDLSNPSSPPLEFHMHNLIPYAHASAVTKLLVVDGQKIVSGARDGSIKLWNFDPANRRFVLVQSLMGHARQVTGFAVADGNFLWSSSTDGSIRIWDLSKNGDCMHAITCKENAGSQPNQPFHTDAVTGLMSFTSSAGTFILSSSLDGEVKAWNGKTGQLVASEGHGEGVTCMSMGEDAAGKQFLLIGLQSGNIMARNLEPTQKIQAAFSAILLLSNRYTAAHSSAVKYIEKGIPGTGTFCSGGMDGKVLVFQVTGDMGL